MVKRLFVSALMGAVAAWSTGVCAAEGAPSVVLAKEEVAKECWRAAFRGEPSAVTNASDVVTATALRRAGLLRQISTAPVATSSGDYTDGTLRLQDGTLARFRVGDHLSGDSLGQNTFTLGKAKCFYECDGGLCAVRFDAKGEVEALAAARLRGFSSKGLKISRLWPGNDIVLVKENGKWRGTVYQSDLRAPLPLPLRAVTTDWKVLPVARFAEKGYRERDARGVEDRIRLIDAPPPGELRVRATFCSCGWRWTSGEKIEGLVAEYRKVGTDEWKRGLPPEYFAETKEYRGSIIYLEEGTEYEVRVKVKGEGEEGNTTVHLTPSPQTFRTWKSDVPVAKTIEIDPATFKSPYSIKEKGTPDGWIRYVVKGGRLELREAEPAFVLKGAAYVLLDDMTIVSRANARFVIDLHDTKDVRIRNCDLSGWGRIGKPDYASTSLGKPTNGRRETINCDGAVNINRGCENTVVERCWIHDPVIGANSWRYSHPAGGQAIVAGYCGPGTVIRYNDFVGSDLHRWNDAVEGPGNFEENGGLNRDADVYGNFMIFCADDNIELDGGQLNVRCFQNRFENALCGVSIQGCMVGPSYVFDNAFTGGTEEFSLGGAEIKTSGVNLYGNYVCSYLFGNDFWKPYTHVNTGDRKMRYVLKDNRSEGEPIFQGFKDSPFSEASGNVGNVSFDRKGTIAMPYRPVPFTLDRNMIEGLDTTSAPVTVTATVGGEGYEMPFVIAQNGDFNWFTVSPAKGVLRSGEKTTFTVTLNPVKMCGRHEYRGAFLVRTADGFSRPVSIYASGIWENAFRPEPQWVFAQYRDWKGGGEYTFKVPRDGKYFVLAHVRGTDGVIPYTAGWDGESPGRGRFQLRPYWTWQLAGFKMYGDARCSVFELKEGEHRFTLNDMQNRIGKDCELDALVLTDDPGPFEPR